MTEYCSFHKNKHDHYEWRNMPSFGWLCKDALDEIEVSIPDTGTFNIGASTQQSRVEHWKDIKSRVRTHTGEFLTGKAGRDYQKKWSGKMLGKDMSPETNFNAPQYQRELAKTTK